LWHVDLKFLAYVVYKLTGKHSCPFFADVTKYPPPDVIIFSRPDVFGANGALEKIIRENGYRPIKTLDGFVIWSK
jgi:hypothetical protein